MLQTWVMSQSTKLATSLVFITPQTSRLSCIRRCFNIKLIPIYEAFSHIAQVLWDTPHIEELPAEDVAAVQRVVPHLTRDSH